MTKEALKKKLAGMPATKRKKYLALLKKRRAEKCAKKKVEDTNDDLKERDAKVEDALKTIFTDAKEVVASRKEGRILKRGITLLSLHKTIQALTVVIEDNRKLLRSLYRSGVTRRTEAAELAASGVATRQVDAKRLYEFVHTVPGLWDRWKCGDAVCAHCPWHRGKGVEAQNLECANDAIKEAGKHNTRVELAKGMPFKKEELAGFPRTRLTQICGLLGLSVFKLPDKSKDGIVKYLTATRQKKLKVTPELKKKVDIPDSLMVE